MDLNTFWALIEKSRQLDTAGDVSLSMEKQEDMQAEALSELLTALPAEQILAFDRMFSDLLITSETDQLYGAAMLINGSASYDGFYYFRQWLIGQGRSVFENALQDPETLIDVVEPGRDDYEWSSLHGAAGTAYEQVAGQALPERDVSEPPPPFPSKGEIGLSWDTVDALHPRLSAYLYPDGNDEKTENNL